MASTSNETTVEEGCGQKGERMLKDLIELIEENKRLKEEVLMYRSQCDALEKELSEASGFTGPKHEPTPSRLHDDVFEFISDMNVYVVNEGQCWHSDETCVASRSRGKSKCLKFRPCLVCLNKIRMNLF